MKIENSTSADLSTIFELYDVATQYQIEKKIVTHWPKFDEQMVLNEIDENRQFKLIIDNQIACVWAITLSDPEIWQELDNESSIYIHRIATNNDFRGQNYIKIIVNWARNYCEQNNKNLIRMDTTGQNEKLILHYTTNGFEFLGLKKLTYTTNLPAHYQNSTVCLFEIKL
jgi:GNAT superfamily N-acetyltransferase